MVSDDHHLAVKISSSDGAADLRVRARVDGDPADVPPGSPFPDLDAARRFAGPLPNTFDYEAATGKIVVIEGKRQDWRPRPVPVEGEFCDFLRSHPALKDNKPVLANAFLVSRVPYRWERGRLLEPGA